MKTHETKSSSLTTWSWCAMVCALATAAPFIAGAMVIGYKAAVISENLGKIPLARLLGSALFCIGFAIGLVSSSVGLVTSAPYKRLLAASGVLLGCCHIALGFAVRSTLQSAVTASNFTLMPALLPLALWAGSIWLALLAAKQSKHSAQIPTQTPSPEQPRVLSPP